MSPTDLRAAAERIRGQARRERIKARLLRFSGEIGDCPSCREHAGTSDVAASMCEQAAALTLATIVLYERAHRLVHGLPPQPERPSLRVVDGGSGVTRKSF